MTEERSPEQDRRPRGQPANHEEARGPGGIVAVELPPDTGTFPRRTLSSFGPPKGAAQGERKSLYERLVASGALDEVVGSDEAHEPVRVAESEPPRPAPAGTIEHALRDLADELEPSRDSVPGERPSGEPLRDSDLHFVAEGRDSGGFVRALAQDPDVDEPPAVARSKRPAEHAPPPLPSMMLAPSLSTRDESTERFPTVVPRTHPLANSMAPTAVRSERPRERQGSALWLGVGSALVVGGAIVFAGLRVTDDGSAAHATVQPRAGVEEAAPRLTPEPAPAVPAPVKVAPAPAPEQAAETTPSTETSAEREAARAERRRLREERAAAQAAAPTRPVAQGDASLPEQPSRDQVVEAMNGVLPRLKECVGEQHGLADVTVTVRNQGFVSYALVAGTFVGTPEGSCIARVVKEAKFPSFREPFVRITYPFQL